MSAAASVLTLAAAAAPMQLPWPQVRVVTSVTDPDASGASARSVGGGHQPDHRDVSRAEQRRIEKRTATILSEQEAAGTATTASIGQIPVYVHVMIGRGDVGDVSNTRIGQQIAVLNQTYSGNDANNAAGGDTGARFTLAGIDRHYNDAWHNDRKSTTYRAATRQGGANAMNIWLVDFKYLGIATFPWDYASQPSIDGIRVNYRSLPGGSDRQLRPRRDRDARGGALARALPHVPGRVHRRRRPRGRHRWPRLADGGCPDGRDSCARWRRGPDPQLHGLQLDSCYYELGWPATRMNQMWARHGAPDRQRRPGRHWRLHRSPCRSRPSSSTGAAP